MPDLDDLLGDPALRAQPELAEEWERFMSLSYDGERLVPAPDKAGALCGMAMTEKQGGSDAREHDLGAAAQRRRTGRGVRDHGPQMVLLGADVRRVPGTRPGGRRPLVLPAPSIHARRRAQRLPHPAAQGQARNQRFERGRVPGRVGAADRRGRPRRPDDHRDGQPHAARLHDRLDGGDAGRGREPRTTAHSARRSGSC